MDKLYVTRMSQQEYYWKNFELKTFYNVSIPNYWEKEIKEGTYQSWRQFISILEQKTKGTVSCLFL